MFAFCQVAAIAGSPLMPNCTMKFGHDAEEARVVEEAVLHQVVEAVGAVRRPVAVHLDHEHAVLVSNSAL